MRVYFTLAVFLSVAKGLFITDDRTRDPSRPLSLPPETPTPTPTHVILDSRQDAPSSSSSGHIATPSIPVAPSTIPLSPPSPAPIPMDLQLSYALSTSCLAHLSAFLSSPTFSSCLPFALLLTTSTSFASLSSTSSTSGNYTLMNELLAYVSSPQPSGAECDAFMRDAHTAMGAKGACGPDLASRAKGVGAAIEARTGLGNAGPMRVAAGLKDPDTGSWCYLQAIKGDRPDDLYLWALPAGIALPPSTRPTCSKCSSLLLNHYTASSTSTPSLHSTLINSAIGRINAACGPGFAQYSVMPPSSSASSARSGSGRSVSGWGTSLAGLAAVASFAAMLVAA